MNYPKVKDFLSHITIDTYVIIEDDITFDHIYFEGKIKDYFKSTVSEDNLTLIQSFIENNIFYVKALKNHDK